jgi:hypothetical protein
MHKASGHVHRNKAYHWPISKGCHPNRFAVGLQRKVGELEESWVNPGKSNLPRMQEQVG